MLDWQQSTSEDEVDLEIRITAAIQSAERDTENRIWEESIGIAARHLQTANEAGKPWVAALLGELTARGINEPNP